MTRLRAGVWPAVGIRKGVISHGVETGDRIRGDRFSGDRFSEDLIRGDLIHLSAKLQAISPKSTFPIGEGYRSAAKSLPLWGFERPKNSPVDCF